MRTALTDTTANAFLIFECVDPDRKDDCRAATEELARFAGGIWARPSPSRTSSRATIAR